VVLEMSELWWWTTVTMVLASSLAGCAEERAGADLQIGMADAVPAYEPSACARRHAQQLERVGDPQSGALVIAKAGQRILAFVADEDERALHTVDVDSMRETAVTPLPGVPAQVLLLSDGRVAVSLRDNNQLAVLEPGADASRQLELRCRAAVASEPLGMAQAGHKLVVASGLAGKVSVLSSVDMRPLRVVDVPREPRAVALSDDGATAFVSHMVDGLMSVLDVDGDSAVRFIDLRVGERASTKAKPDSREANQGFALAKASIDGSGRSRIFAPQVAVDPGETVASFSGGYGGDGLGPRPIVPLVAVVDTEGERNLTHSLANHLSGSSIECLLPRAAVARGHSLWLACLGQEAVIELDTRFADPTVTEKRRVWVGAGPTGLAFGPSGNRLFVWSQFARELANVDLHAADVQAGVSRISLARRASASLTPQLERGRRLFHATNDARISLDGRACASCHPDGRDDGLVWSSPDGARQTKMLAGRLADSAPYGWFGEHTTLLTHVEHTIARLGGSGFDHPSDAVDLKALIAYITALPAPKLAVDDGDERVARGKRLFEADEQGCGKCHDGGGTDATAYDVGSGTEGERQRQFDTPSLRFLAASAPYFHDGRYATLRELLRKTDGTMGHTGSLDERELEALEAYLLTL
jgi:mono/diheme cytochrome c family protein